MDEFVFYAGIIKLKKGYYEIFSNGKNQYKFVKLED